MKPIKRPGRPRKSSEEKLLERFELRLLPAEKKAFQDAANLAGIELSAWVRERLRRAAIRDLEEVGRPIAFLEGGE